MKKILLMWIFLLSAGPVLATSTYCQDPVTHKRISCKTAPTPTTPTNKPATHTSPMASTPMAPPAATATSAHKGKKCGNSYIAQNKECHKS